MLFLLGKGDAPQLRPFPDVRKQGFVQGGAKLQTPESILRDSFIELSFGSRDVNEQGEEGTRFDQPPSKIPG